MGEVEDKERKIDSKRYRESLARLQEVFAGISRTVTDVSRWRCPYKDAANLCTAQLRCRNQERAEQGGVQILRCAGDDLTFEAVTGE